MSDLRDLIARLEAATEGGWELDAEIYWAISEWINQGGRFRRHKVTGAVEWFNYIEPPRYTSSLDAALARELAEALHVLKTAPPVMDYESQEYDRKANDMADVALTKARAAGLLT